jgi:hypothetical protein
MAAQNTARIEDTPPSPDMTVRIALGGETRWATLATWSDVADELVAKHGGTPKVDNLAPPNKASSAIVLSAAPSTPTFEPKREGHDVIGEARSIVDLEAAVAAGFAPKATIFRRGTMVNSTGVANAARSRAAHDALPGVGPACADFVTRIEAEKRSDEIVPLAAVRMTKGGLLALPDKRYSVTERAFETLVGYHSGIGGAAYLTKCWPELRAINVNHWMTALGQSEIKMRNGLDDAALAKWEPRAVRLRTRDSNSSTTPREVFGVVSPKRYTNFDVDMVARALDRSMPRDAKCRIVYDGRGAIFDVQFHSNVQPKDYVAGEFFKAGIRVRTDDTGGGSLVGDALVFQNLCLNLIIIDRASTPLFRLRHTGTVEALATRFAEGMKDALGRLEHFLTAWNYAADDNRVQPFEGVSADDMPMKVSELMPGIFNSIIERELVPVRGRRDETIPKLMTMWEADTSYAAHGHKEISRGAVVNAFTRYAHEVEQDDFNADEIEHSVSSLLYGKGQSKPAPLTYLPVGRKTDAEVES